MMMLGVSQIAGMEGLPSTGPGIRKWLQRNKIPLIPNGKRFTFSLTDLPEDVQRAYRLRTAEQKGQAAGNMNDDAHRALTSKSGGVQTEADRRAHILGIVLRLESAGLSWAEIQQLALPEIEEGQLGDLPSKKTVDRWKKLIEGVDPINWPPALAPRWTGCTARAALSQEAWEWFKFHVAASSGNGSCRALIRAYADVSKEAAANGWHWPSYKTVCRLWAKTPASERRTLELGADEAIRSLTQYIPRATDGMRALEQVEMDGREHPPICYWDDGHVGCPTVIELVDRASSFPLGYAIAKSENAEATREAILSTAEQFGIFDLLLTDNGAAFNSFAIAGGLKPMYRTKQQRDPRWSLPGVLKVLGVELQNTGVGNARAKLPESCFSALRHHIDKAPEFYGSQRPGPNDKPSGEPVPISIHLFTAVYARRRAEFCAMPCRTQQARPGESRNDVFQRLIAGRIARTITPRQRQLCNMEYHERTVDSYGRVSVANRLYGNGETQNAMLAYEGKKLLVGVVSNDPETPALAFLKDGDRWRELMDLPHFPTVAVNSAEGRAAAAAEKRRAKTVVRSHLIPDLAQKVEDLRERAMAWTPEGVEIPRSNVAQIDTRSPFSPAPPLHKARACEEPGAAAKDAEHRESLAMLARIARDDDDFEFRPGMAG